MKQQHWESAFWLALSVLILTNAAQFYSRRVALAEATTPDCAPIATPREVQVMVGPFRQTERLPHPMGSPTPLGGNEKCIAGQRFRKVGNEWLQLAANC